MKLLTNLAVFAIVLLAFTGCKKEKKAEEANVTFKFEHFVDEKQIEMNSPFNYTNAAGNNYNVSLLKYYISHVVLIDASGKETELNNNDLIDAFGNSQLDPVTLPNGDYVKMRFIFGVDATNNSTGEQSGDLDPSNGMFWSWATGYIFSKHEGKFLNSSNTEQNLELHLGGQGNQTEIEINNIGLKVDGSDKEAFISFNLNNMYNDPVIDFNTDNNRHNGPDDATWVGDTKSNMGDVFAFNGSNVL